MVRTFMLADDGTVPNNPILSVVMMTDAIKPDEAYVTQRYQANGWGGAWAYTVFDYAHYHSDAHEVLTCVQGWADLRLGGENGRALHVIEGDCIVLPAGTGHQRLEASDAFLVVGGYPPGQEAPEIRRATPENYAGTPARVAAVERPKTCPIGGATGPTMQAWSTR